MNAIRMRVGPVMAILLATAWSGGCHGIDSPQPSLPPADVPRELVKVTLPDYRVEPPDILLIEAVRAVPKPPYKAEPLDVLFVQLPPAVPNEPPLSGTISVEPDGTINLGAAYRGSVSVVGKTLPEIQKAIEKHLVEVLKLNPKAVQVTVSLAQGQAAQRISGPHLIRQDGTLSLGTYGSVRVTGMALAEVRQAIETHLSAFLLNPEISVDVQGFNSKLFYVILDGGGAGRTVQRFPITGNETVLDAVAQVSGLTAVSSQNRIWISRPAPAGAEHQILRVDWHGITECGDTASNYQLMPGDRVFIAAYPLVKFDNTLARAFAPIERVLGITLLGTNTSRYIRFFNHFLGGSSTGSGGAALAVVPVTTP